MKGGRRRSGPGEGLLGYGALGAVVVLLVNDHLLKGVGPGWLTGKLSDFAGLVFFPLLLQAVVEVGGSLMGRFEGPSNRALYGATAATGLVFSAIQLWPEANELWRWSLGALQWPFRLLGDAEASIRPVASWSDPTDLLMLPGLGVAVWLGRSAG